MHSDAMPAPVPVEEASGDVPAGSLRVAVLTGSLSRQAGGLFWSVRALSGALIRQGMALEVFGSRDAATDEDAPAWRGIPIHPSDVLGPRTFSYRPALRGQVRSFRPQLIHTHGIWGYSSVVASQWRAAGIPTVISPRGMIDPWAVGHARWKKTLAAAVYENRHLRGASCLHALGEEEYRAIRGYGLRNPVAIIPNGIDMPVPEAGGVPQWRKSLPPDSKVLLFLGRLHPKKGLEVLLEAWAAARQSGQASGWHLVVGGWDQNYLQQLQQLVARLGVGESVHFPGPLFDGEKDASFRAADAFVLPSFSEGLPMAVLEAWSYGLPVLMTAECNLPIGFEKQAAIPVLARKAELADSLQQFFALDRLALRRMGSNGRQLVEESFGWPRLGAALADVYHWLLGHAPMPPTVRLD